MGSALTLESPGGNLLILQLRIELGERSKDESDWIRIGMIAFSMTIQVISYKFHFQIKTF